MRSDAAPRLWSAAFARLQRHLLRNARRLPGAGRATKFLAAKRGLIYVFPLALPLAWMLLLLIAGQLFFDFKGGLYDGGRDILHGHDPYRADYLRYLAEVKEGGGKPETIIGVPVYPAPALVAILPLSLLPFALAGAIWFVLSAAALVLALRLVGVTDRRCYALAFAPLPAVSSYTLGAVSPLLCLGAAAAWRYRDRALPAAVAIAAVVAGKLFLWPLAVWLAITRRGRTAFLAFVIALTATIAAWEAIGLVGLWDYPQMLDDLSYVSEGVGISPVAGLLALGASESTARMLALLAAVLVLVLAIRVARREDGDRRAFSLALVASLVASPMVWPHYLVLLTLPIGLVSPRLSPLWLVPICSYFAPFGQTGGHPWAIAVYLAIVAVVAYAAACPPSGEPFARDCPRLGMAPGPAPITTRR